MHDVVDSNGILPKTLQIISAIWSRFSGGERGLSIEMRRATLFCSVFPGHNEEQTEVAPIPMPLTEFTPNLHSFLYA